MSASHVIASDRMGDIRNRFIGFAFAAADLMVEVGADRRIQFAAGAFRERFGEEACAFEGRLFSSLIAPDDQAGLEIALSLLAGLGRLTPVSLRLATTSRLQVAMSGLRLPSRDGASWITLSRMPAPPQATNGLAAAPLLQGALEARLRAAESCDIGMVDIAGWQSIPVSARAGLEAEIATAMRNAGGAGALAAELADGRFGVLADAGIDMPELQQRVTAILRAASAADAVRPVTGLAVPLRPGDLNPAEAMRVMRYALTSFSTSGAGALRDAGFDQGLRHFLDRAETRAATIRSAIEHGRFRLMFQPVVRLADRTLHHYEALLRPYPIDGQEGTTTQEFVSFAEAIGLAETLDEAVLHRTADTILAAKARIAVNVSGFSMQSARFRDMLLGIIAAKPELSNWLMIELTETADIEDVPAAVDTVNRLSAAAIPVCLDDFGAGFAAFRYLKEFKVDFVKIDGSYVRNAHSGARESGFVGAMVELARCVGAETIAETVETEAQAAAMTALGVQLGQGWLFGKPGALTASR